MNIRIFTWMLPKALLELGKKGWSTCSPELLVHRKRTCERIFTTVSRSHVLFTAEDSSIKMRGKSVSTNTFLLGKTPDFSQKLLESSQNAYAPFQLCVSAIKSKLINILF